MTARLDELLRGIAAAPELRVTGLSADSRQLRPGDVFFALAGARTHGLAHAVAALAAGAVAILWEPGEGADAALAALPPGSAPLLRVEGLARQAGIIASRFHGEPSRQLAVVGITGTDGKTSCSHYLSHALHRLGMPCGLLGTLGHGPDAEHLVAGPHTTPGPLDLQSALAALLAGGSKAVAMEVSSHALDQGRAAGTQFSGAVFTQLGRDHLDYHRDLAEYAAAKRQLFAWPGLGFAALNQDDASGARWAGELEAATRVIRYGLNPEGMAGEWIAARRVQADADGLQLDLQDSDGARASLQCGLLGRFNAANLLAVLAALRGLGHGLADSAAALAGVRGAPGRMERLAGPGQALAVVDYAHTPDALRTVLGTLRDLGPRRLWCVFGCGGERDRGKRPLMGAVAEALSDHVVLTDDNPRGEDATAIVADIQRGMRQPDRAYVHRDRASAIRFALEQAGERDIVLVAGKGHEEYQWVGGRRLPFSDRQAILDCHRKARAA
jgi:UDP-N-acetylmuramoyl-L-alanyl-D-glutamate--2,6-diaminopimelate ligase